MINTKKISLQITNYEDQIDLVYALINNLIDMILYTPSSKYMHDLECNISGPITLSFTVDMSDQPDIINTLNDLDILNSKQRKAIINRRAKSKRPYLTSCDFALFLMKEMVLAVIEGTKASCVWKEEDKELIHIETLNP